MAVKAYATDERAKFADLSFEDIMSACEKAGQMGWLEEAMNRPMEHWKWQRRTVEIPETGKKKKVIDKTLPKVMELRKPTFIELKEMYMVEICGIKPAKKKPKPLTMAEKLALRLGEIEAAKEEEADEIDKKLGFEKK